jgi:hypothetical protein
MATKLQLRDQLLNMKAGEVLNLKEYLIPSLPASGHLICTEVIDGIIHADLMFCGVLVTPVELLCTKDSVSVRKAGK